MPISVLGGSKVRALERKAASTMAAGLTVEKGDV